MNLNWMLLLTGCVFFLCVGDCETPLTSYIVSKTRFVWGLSGKLLILIELSESAIQLFTLTLRVREIELYNGALKERGRRNFRYSKDISATGTAVTSLSSNSFKN